MSSFASLWETVEMSKEPPLEQDDGHSKSDTVYAKQDPDFWDKLANLANSDPAGIGELLGVNPEQVSTWSNKIKMIASKAKRAKAEIEQPKVLPTGFSFGKSSSDDY